MAYQVKILAAKPESLNLILRTDRVEGENQLPKVVPLPP